MIKAISAGEDLERFRADVRDWAAQHVPRGWEAGQTAATDEEFVAFQAAWFATLREGGLAVPHWPAAWGGGFSLVEQMVIFEELARANAPRLVLQFVSIHHAAATLLGAGTDEQRLRHLPAILDGEVWCQGFSEPDAGSDLASLTTRAVRDGDDYVVTGQKVWASLAMYADWCLLLVRTDPSAPKRKGISYLLMDMRSRGLDVRPIRQATGEAHFCEIFLDEVRVPVGNLIGAENDGWRVAQSTLGSERGMTIVELAQRLNAGYRWLVELCQRTPAIGGRTAADLDAVRERLAELGTKVRALTLLCRQLVATLEASGGVGPEASIVKLYYSELLQELTAFGVEVEGLSAHTVLEKPKSAGWESGSWMLDFIGSWEWTIPGGTSEIQRNIIASRGLGLPRY
jgi:alkylation response protein AidB-like acyl-CoA dehydrogenase